MKYHPGFFSLRVFFSDWIHFDWNKLKDLCDSGYFAWKINGRTSLWLQLCMLKKEWLRPGCSATQESEIDLDDLKKIRKVQGFFRGWLCRHRWKVIVEEYIKSPHAESMRKRNRLNSLFTFFFCLPPSCCIHLSIELHLHLILVSLINQIKVFLMISISIY